MSPASPTTPPTTSDLFPKIHHQPPHAKNIQTVQQQQQQPHQQQQQAQHQQQQRKFSFDKDYRQSNTDSSYLVLNEPEQLASASVAVNILTKKTKCFAADKKSRPFANALNRQKCRS